LFWSGADTLKEQVVLALLTKAAFPRGEIIHLTWDDINQEKAKPRYHTQAPVGLGTQNA
jgi:hypothetical protein